MFAAVTLADQIAKRGYSSVSCPRLKTDVDVGICVCVCVDQGGSGPGGRDVERDASVSWDKCLSVYENPMQHAEGIVRVEINCGKWRHLFECRWLADWPASLLQHVAFDG
jgi:hypothetical protein